MGITRVSAKIARIFHPTSLTHEEDFRFGLENKADTLRLYRPDGSVALSISYSDQSPWPTGADGTGFTLQLHPLTAEPSSPSSWRTSVQRGGSPGKE